MNLKLLFPLFAAAMTLPLAARAEIRRVVEKDFHVSADQLLRVETQGGNIRVKIGGDDQVHVVAQEKFRASTEAEADEIAKGLTVDISQNSDGIEAMSKFDRDAVKSSGSWWHGFQSQVEVSFEVTVPRRFRADLKTSGGNISVGDLAGKIVAGTSGGNISLGHIDGEVSAHTSGGNIDVENAVQRLSVSTSGGEIHAKRVDGDADLRTSGGNIRIDAVSGIVHAETSGGNVEASFTRAPKADCELRTSGGDVNVRIVADAAVKLDASTSGGSVEVSSLTVEVESGGFGKSHLVGKIHGGGPLLRLRTSGGEVRVSAS